jgi:Ca-activated chloride channel family protein
MSLADRATWQQDAEIPGEVKQTALDFGLMSPFTAFVAVDSLSKTQGQYGTTVHVPVPVPEGVRYDTTVPGGAERRVQGQ